MLAKRPYASPRAGLSSPFGVAIRLVAACAGSLTHGESRARENGPGRLFVVHLSIWVIPVR